MSYEQCTAGDYKSSTFSGDNDSENSSGGSCPTAESSNVVANKKVALITGITGQDGSYLAEFLIKKGYEVSSVKLSLTDNNTESTFFGKR